MNKFQQRCRKWKNQEKINMKILNKKTTLFDDSYNYRKKKELRMILDIVNFDNNEKSGTRWYDLELRNYKILK